MKAEPTFKLTVSKVDKLLFKGEATSVTLPGERGELTILAHHEPLITLLKKGIIIVREQEGIQEFPVEKGMCETSNGQVTILV
jgi:F-type H+-transporting ATPase subunit epsilon